MNKYDICKNCKYFKIYYHGNLNFSYFCDYYWCDPLNDKNLKCNINNIEESTKINTSAQLRTV